MVNNYYLLRTFCNTAKIFCDLLSWTDPLTVYFTIEMLLILILTWSVHHDKPSFLNRKTLFTYKPSFLNRKTLFTSENNMYKKQNDLMSPSGISVFACIFFYFSSLYISKCVFKDNNCQYCC